MKQIAILIAGVLLVLLEVLVWLLVRRWGLRAIRHFFDGLRAARGIPPRRRR